MNNTELRQVDLAHLAGVRSSAARAAFRGKLKPALTPDGTRVYRDHPLVQAYINLPAPQRRRALRAAVERSVQRGEPQPPPPAPKPLPFAAAAAVAAATNDPFAAAAEAAKLPAASPVSEPASRVSGFMLGSRLKQAADDTDPDDTALKTLLETQRQERTDRELRALWETTGGALPKGLADLGALTLREVCQQWGTLGGLVDAVKASKLFAEFQLREVEAQKKRGELIDLAAVSGVLVPLVDQAFRRCTGEAPPALREVIVARVLSAVTGDGGAGQEDLAHDVEQIIHKELSGILGDCRDSLADRIGELSA